MRRYIAAVFLTSGLFLAFGSGTASATIDEPNEIGCEGSATVVTDDGRRIEVDADQSEVTLPRKGLESAIYHGSTTEATHHHSGSVWVEIGPLKLKLGSWGSPNDGGETSKDGTKKIPSGLDLGLPGIYTIKGEHHSDEGDCSGSLRLTLEGSPFSSPTGLGVLGGTVVFAALMMYAAMPTKRSLKARH
jgi:hypothetical protein